MFCKYFRSKKIEKAIENSHQTYTGKRLAIIVGHDNKSKGAKLNGYDLYEYDYWSEVAEICTKIAAEKGLEIMVFKRDSIGIEGAYKLANKYINGEGLIIELHFNAYNEKISGCEVLYNDEFDDRGFNEKEIADIFLRSLCHATNVTYPSRGLKYRSRNERGWYSLSRTTTCPSILIEPFFGDNKDQAAHAFKNKDQMAEAIINSFLSIK